MEEIKKILKNKMPFLPKLKSCVKSFIFGETLAYLEFQIVEHCNLNCKGCMHFSNITPPKFIDFKHIRKRLLRINEMFHKVKEIKIMGGEPLLHPDAAKIISFARQTFPSTKISLVTNGLLLTQMTDVFFETLRDGKIILEVSAYPPVENHLKDIIAKASQFNIKTDINRVFNFYAVISCKEKSDEEKFFSDCCEKWCTILKDDKIYVCPLTAYIDKFNIKFGKNIPAGKGINIFSNGAKEILKHILQPEQTCKYCIGYRYFKWEKSVDPQPLDWNGKQSDE